MEKETILSVKQLSKTYRKNKDEDIIALNQIDFDLAKGEILGVIGRNGAGKSTLLKVLSHITPPSSGKVEYEGILCSIIEIGTGFHPDLSGKDNIYLSASLLGQSKKETDNALDDIIAFSGLESFMDMPIKHYSSGMYLRLAFSVAFFSKIDILLLDEVIAVGDASFRRKCYEKIRDLKAAGVAIMLVSHSMENIIEFCDRCLCLSQGNIVFQGKAIDIVEKYMEFDINTRDQIDQSNKTLGKADFNPIKTDFVDVNAITVKAVGKRAGEKIQTEDTIEIILDCTKHQGGHSLETVISISTVNDLKVLIDSYGLRKDYKPNKTEKGRYQIRCMIPDNLLNRGIYRIGLILGKDKDFIHESSQIGQFKIHAGNDGFEQQIGTIIRPKLNWEVKKLDPKN